MDRNWKMDIKDIGHIGIFRGIHGRKLSHQKKKTALLSMKYWLVDRDPYYNGLLINIL